MLARWPHGYRCPAAIWATRELSQAERLKLHSPRTSRNEIEQIGERSIHLPKAPNLQRFDFRLHCLAHTNQTLSLDPQLIV